MPACSNWLPASSLRGCRNLMPSPALLVRLRPTGPWRLAPESGTPDRVDRLLRSDTLFSALCSAMQQLGHLEDWLAAALENNPPVRLSSGFPFSGQTVFVTPPRHVWPPATAGKVRWKSARFVPLTALPSLLQDEDLNPEKWTVDPVSECLLPLGRHGAAPPPYRVVSRKTAPVDRLTMQSVEAHETACLEFSPGAGLWSLVEFSNEETRQAWMDRVRGAFRLLADTGIGGGKSKGWGRSRTPQFQDVVLPEFLLGEAGPASADQTGYWMLSLFNPGHSDTVDWRRGDYSVVTRQGRGLNGSLKRASRMVDEGSVLFAESAPAGRAQDVALEGSAHPLYRSGIAMAISVGVRAMGLKYRSAFASVEEPVVTATEETRIDETVVELPAIEEPAAEDAPPTEDTPSTGDAPAEEPPMESPGIEEPPVESPPAEEPPVQEPPMYEPPSEEPEPQSPPVEEPRREEPPAGEPRPDETPRRDPDIAPPAPMEAPGFERPSEQPLPSETPSIEPTQTFPTTGDMPGRSGM